MTMARKPVSGLARALAALERLLGRRALVPAPVAVRAVRR
jgi:hypothetical protein